MKRALTSVVALVLVLSLTPGMALAEEEPLFTKTNGFATKTGYRGVFTWEATQPVDGVVLYGTSPSSLSEATRAIPGAADTAQIAIAEGLSVGTTYYWRVEDLLTGELSEIKSFEATNAYTDWNGSSYTLDLLVQLDTESLQPGVPADLALQNIAQGINIFAERLWDAMDGFARLGNVLVTDTELDFGGNIPFFPPGCFTGLTNAADVLIQTSVPFDSHTFGGWSIEDPCISFYVGRLGQLIVPWGFGGSDEDLHFGYVAAHEMMHYAFNAPDLYNPEDVNDPRVAGCWNLDWDGSLMHNSGGWAGDRWELTELDRNPSLTPCDHQHSSSWTWDALRARYSNVPLSPAGPIDHVLDTQARGNDDGGALNIQILDRTPASSSLSEFTANDGVLLTDRCTEPGFTVLTDASYDSLDTISEHDVEWAAVAEPFELGPGKIVFVLKIASLANPTPDTTWPLVFRDPAGANRFARMSTDAVGRVSFATGLAGGTDANPNPGPVGAAGTPALPESSFTPDGTIRVVANRSDVGLAPGRALSQFITRVRVELPTGGALTPDNMPGDLSRTGIYTSVGSENCMSAPPVAVDDSAATLEDNSVDIPVLANDSDPEGKPLQIVSISAPKNGTASVVGPAVRYTPNPNFNGSDSFTYQISNGAASASAGVSVSVAPAPDAPQAFDDRVTIAAGTSFRIPVLGNDSDPDGDALFLVGATDPAKGTTQANPDGTVRYTPDPGASGSDTFSYTVSDGAFTDQADVFVQVIAEGAENPCLLPGRTIVTDAADDQTAGNAGSYDVRTVWAGGLFPDGQIVFTMKVTGPLNPPPVSTVWRMRFTGPSGTVYYVSMETLDVLGTPTFRYGTISGSFISDVGPADSGTFTPEGYITIGLSASKLSLVAPGSVLGPITGQTQRFVGGPGAGGFIQIDATAAGSFTVAACLQEPPNDPPSAIDDLIATDEDSSAAVSVLGNDSDRNGDPLSIVEFGQGVNGSVVRSGNSLVYDPNLNFNGSDSFAYTISDGQGTASAMVHITVVPVNDVPVAFDDSVTTEEDTAVVIAAAANDTDVDGDTLSAASVSAPVNGFAEVNPDGTITYRPVQNYFGADMFTYQVSDGNGGSDSATVFVTVTPVNDPSQAVADTATCTKNKSVTLAVLANDFDVEDGSVRLTDVTQPANGTVRVNLDDSITYRPVKRFVGTDTFTYTVTDQDGATATAVVTISVVKPSESEHGNFVQLPDLGALLLIISQWLGLI